MEDKKNILPNTEGSKIINISIGAFYVMCIFFSFFLNNQVKDNFYTGGIILISTLISYYYIDVKLHVNLKTLVISILAATFFIIINLENLTNSLVGDHWYHTFFAFAVPIIILMKFGESLPDIQLSHYLQIYSLLMILCILFSFWLHKKSKLLFIILIFILAIFMMIVSSQFGLLNPDKHPSLRLLPLSLLGAIGFDSWIFRLQGVLPLLIIIYFILSSSLITIQKIYCILFLFTMPVLYFNTLLVEYSVWTFVGISLLYLSLVEKKILNERNIIILSYTLTLFGLIRGTALFGLLPLVIHALVSKQLMLIPKIIVISVPSSIYLITAKFEGTPASYIPDELFLTFPTNMSTFERLISSISRESAMQLLVTSGPVILGLIAYLIFKLIFQRRWQVISYLFISLIIFWSIFHIIRPILWGVPRYQLEYIAPLGLLGFWILIKSLNRKYLYLINVLTLINIFLIFKIYDNMPDMNYNYTDYFQGNTPVLSEKVYNIQQAVDNSMAQCNGQFNLGSGYIDHLPLIFSGAKVSQYANSIYNSSNSEYGFKATDNIIECTAQYLDGDHGGDFYNSIRNTTVLINTNYNQKNINEYEK